MAASSTVLSQYFFNTFNRFFMFSSNEKWKKNANNENSRCNDWRMKALLTSGRLFTFILSGFLHFHVKLFYWHNIRSLIINCSISLICTCWYKEKVWLNFGLLSERFLSSTMQFLTTICVLAFVVLAISSASGSKYKFAKSCGPNYFYFSNFNPIEKRKSLQRRYDPPALR